jgi:hypothetical protein
MSSAQANTLIVATPVAPLACLRVAKDLMVILPKLSHSEVGIYTLLLGHTKGRTISPPVDVVGFKNMCGIWDS